MRGLLLVCLFLFACDSGSDGDGDTDADVEDADVDAADADEEVEDEDADQGDADVEVDADHEVVESELTIPTLTAPVIQRINQYGMIHLTCQTDEDCMRALGYVHATRNFYQMQNMRQWARGRVSRLWGERYIDYDLTQRSYFSTAEGEPLEEVMWERMSDETHALVEAYTEGVNAWLEDLRNGRNGAVLPPQFSVINGVDVVAELEDWDPLDVVAGYTSYRMKPNSDYYVPELEDQVSREALSEELYSDLLIGLHTAPISGSYIPIDGVDSESGGLPRPLPPRPGPQAGARPQPSAALLAQARAHDARLREAVERMGAVPGSNNWALSAEFTGGDAILASDPHSPPYTPSRINVVILDSVTEGEGTFLGGGALSYGLLVEGQGVNEHIAWGFTTSNADTSDVYLETLNEDRTAVIFNGEEVPIIERELEFFVANSEEPVTRTARWVPHHGPVVAWDPVARQALTRRWVGHEAPTDFEATLDLMRAGSVAEAVEVLERCETSGSNIVVADDAGDVAWHVTVRYPNRPWASPELAPWLPLPGDGSAEWDGFVPLEQHTRSVNPASGYVNTSNNAYTDAWADGDPTNDGLPFYQSFFKPGWRYNRVVELLEATRGDHTVENSLAIQLDTYANPAATILPGILTAVDEDDDGLNSFGRAVVDSLRDWELTCPTGLEGNEPNSAFAADAAEARESIGCTAYHAAMVHVGIAALADEFEAAGIEDEYHHDIAQSYLHRYFTAPETLLTGDTLWDDVSTDEVETPRETIIAGLNDAGNYLDVMLDDDPDEWRWGRLHYLSLSGMIDVDELRAGNWACAGGENTVARADFEFAESGFQHTHGQLMRMVVELTEDGPETYFQIIAGLSSLPGSAYYNTLNEQWSAGEPVSIPFTIDEADYAAVELIELLPEE